MLTRAELERYSRQLLLEDVGHAGQERLARARVLVVGVGGLGSPAALYLAAAGVGTIGLADGDTVELSNLNRQIAHTTADLDARKVESAASKLRALNPGTTVDVHPEVVTPRNAVQLLGGYDFVIDGSDNFATKFLLNDAARLAGRPVCLGGVEAFQGQVLTVLPDRPGCCRCLFGEPPPQGTVRRCARLGVLGAVAGVIGSLQALEALKCLLGLGEPLFRALLVFDALTGSFRKLAFEPDPSCPLCGRQPTITAPGAPQSSRQP